MNNIFQMVSYEVKDEIGYFVITDPPANKMTRQFFTEFNRIVKENIIPSNVKGILIYGKGRHFSCGADIEQLVDNVIPYLQLDDNDDVMSYPAWLIENKTAFYYFNRLQIPVLSAITGLCIGSGTELALCSHVRICGKGSVFGLPESTFGFLPGACGTLMAVEILGLGKALEKVLSGEMISADEALEIGLIDKIVNKKQTLSYTENLLKYIITKEREYSRNKIETYITNFENCYPTMSELSQ